MKIVTYKMFIRTSPLALLMLCVAMLLLSYAAPGQSAPQSETLEEKSKRGESLFHEASGLFQAKTPESLRAAAAKFLEAKVIFRELGLTQKEGFCLSWLGGINDKLDEPRVALDYFKQALRIFESLADKPDEAETRFAVGNVYIKLGDDNAALEYFEPALAIFNTAGPKARAIDTLKIIGNIYHRSGNTAKALALNGQALEVAKSAGDKKREVQVLYNLGSLHFMARDLSKAAKIFEEMLAIAQAQDDKKSEAEALEKLAMVYRTNGDGQKALAILERSLRLAKEQGDKSAEAKALNELAETNLELGGLEAALKFAEEALKVSVATADKAGEGAALLNIGLVQARWSEGARALETLKKAADLLQTTGDFEKLALARMVTGGIYSKFGDKRKALEASLQALAISKIGGFKHIEVEVANNVGAVYFDVGEIEKALEYYRQALPLAKQLGFKETEARILVNIGNAMRYSGDSPAAIERLQQAGETFKSLGDRPAEITSMIDIGGIYLDLGENEKALGSYMQAMFLTLEGIVDSNKESAAIYRDLFATILNNLGRVHSEMGALRSALKYYIDSLDVLREIKDRNRESITLTNIAGIYSELGEYEKAADFLNQAMAIAKETGNRSQEATILNNFGALYSDQGDKQKAAEYYGESLPLLKILGDPRREAITLTNLMSVYESLGRHRVAILYGKLAVNTIQILRSRIRTLDKETQKTYLSKVDFAYRGLAALLIKESRPSEAQQVLNAFKDQQFFDLDPSNPKELKPLTLTEREADLAARLEKASRSDMKAASDDFAKVLKQLESELTREPDKKDKVGEVADTVEMRASLNELERKTGQKAVAVYTLVGEESFNALIISSDQIKSVSAKITNDVLNEKAKKLWALLQSPTYDTTVLSKEIYDIVFKPIEEKLPKDTKTILWSLDGNLRYVPMGALFDGKQYLIERYNMVNFTRADAERMTRPVSAKWSGTGFGTSKAHTVSLLGNSVRFSALPGVTAEFEQIFKTGSARKGVLEGQVLHDEKFDQKTMLEQLKAKRPVVHIASHFSFRPGDEARSFLLMGDGTAFTLADMKKEPNMFAGVELLTLSACNTAAQQADANGKEIDGFAELAQRLGANAVLATLWPVADTSTPWLMREFYRGKLERKLTKAESLRKAQISLLNANAAKGPEVQNRNSAQLPNDVIVVTKDGKRDSTTTRADTFVLSESEAPLYKKDPKRPFAHPYYWSPFILFGNWQ